MDLSNNELRTIPLEIGNLPLKQLFCWGNLLISPLDSLRDPYSYKNREEYYTRALSLLRACMEGTTKYRQIKLIFIGSGREGKVIAQSI